MSIVKDPVVDAFTDWWWTFGSGMAPEPGEDREEHAQRVAEAAWVACEHENHITREDYEHMEDQLRLAAVSEANAEARANDAMDALARVSAVLSQSYYTDVEVADFVREEGFDPIWIRSDELERAIEGEQSDEDDSP